MIRASLRYVPFAQRKHIVGALRAIYGADTEDAARLALDAFDERFGRKYPGITKLWQTRWNEVVPFLSYPDEIRRILYTTNAVESLNFQLRKVLRPKGHFPSDDAVLKVVYLAIQHASFKWKPARDWTRAIAHFAIVFGDRLPA
jgi:putative transposase